jgi:hypothetical protein
MKEVEVIQVVHTRLLRRGEGVPGDPIRIIDQYWGLDGELLAEVDNWMPHKKEQLQQPNTEKEDS